MNLQAKTVAERAHELEFVIDAWLDNNDLSSEEARWLINEFHDLEYVLRRLREGAFQTKMP